MCRNTVILSGIANHDPGLRNVMKIVRNPNRWLRKLSRAAALISLAAYAPSAFSQDGAFSFGRTPTGSASEVVDSNRDGFGMSFRGGHTAGDTVGRSDSITHINLMPYVNIENGLLFGDSRLLRGNDGGLGFTFGGGYRHYIEALDVVLGGNGYYDHDELTGAGLEQWGVGAELLANRWEARGNYYQTFGNTFELVGQGIDQNSVAFAGQNITYTRVDTFAEGLKGFDSELGVLLPGKLSERIDLRAFGGGYYYEGDNIDGFAGWSARLQADIGKWLEVGMKVTDDEQFDTTVSFQAAVYFGGFSSQEHTSRSAIQRFRDPVRRNMNVVALTTNVDAPGQIANAQGGAGVPLVIAHVNSNGAGPGTGTVDDPFLLLTQGMAAGADIVFVHAGSTFDAAPENILNLAAGDRVIGEGLIVPGRDVVTQIPVSILGQTFQLTLPDSPTFAAAPGLARPTLTNAAGNGVTMANDSVLSGFIINTPLQNGIFSDGAEDFVINDTSIINPGLSGILLQNTIGTANITNTSIVSTTSAAPSFRINGGNGNVNFVSNDDFLLGSITNTAPVESLLVENMTGGRFTMNRSSITDDGGLGVVIRNNTGGTATLDNISVSNSGGTGIAILNSAGDYVIRKSDARLAATTILNPAAQGVLIQNVTGDVTFTDPLLVQGRQAGGVEIAGSSGTVRFTGRVSVLDHAGAGTEAGISIHDQQANSQVIFADPVIVGVGTTLPVQSNRGNGIFIADNLEDSEVIFQDSVSVSNTLQEAIFINNISGEVSFQGVTSVTNRTLEGISINNSSGLIELGQASADRTEVQNELNSQAAAVEVIGNSGTVRMSNIVVVNAQGNAGGGAGLHIVDNTGLDPVTGDPIGLVRINDLDIESLNGIGMFGLNNNEISIDDGIIDSTTAAAVNIEDSGINIHLETVNSTGSPDYGIRLVNTNRDQKKTFIVQPNVANATPGSGGIISDADGNLLDDNDAAGILLLNAGQVTVTDMILDDNEFGVRIINTEDPAEDIDAADEQFFRIIDSQVIDSDIRGIHAQNLMGLEVQNTEFDNNGDNPVVGRETIFLDYTLNLDVDPATTETNPRDYSRADRPFEVLIENSGFVSNSGDVIRIFQSSATAQGAAIRTRIFSNSFEVNDTIDPATANPNDGRPLFDDAITMEWFGAARVQVDNNRIDLRATEQQHAFDLTNQITGNILTEFSFQNNVITVNNLGNDEGVVSLDLFGNAFSNDNVFQIAGNTIRMAGVTPTAFFLSLRGQSDIAFDNNAIRSESDGGTGIEIRRVATNSFIQIFRTNLEFRDLGGADERGFVFTQVGGVINIAGTGNNMAIISNGINGNAFIEDPFIIPANSSVGTIEINGVLFP
jgi:hypothetical protein